MPNLAGWFLTFMFFAVSLVLFRSEDFAVSDQMWTAMSGIDGVDWGGDGMNQNDFLLILARPRGIAE